MNGGRKSDRVVVPGKLPNKAKVRRGDRAAEAVEGRTLTKENSQRQNTYRAQNRSACKERWSEYGERRERIEGGDSQRCCTT